MRVRNVLLRGTSYYQILLVFTARSRATFAAFHISRDASYSFHTCPFGERELLVKIQIKLKDIDSGFPQDSECSAFRVLRNQCSKLINVGAALFSNAG
jgi:hypothetical protein